MVSLEEVTEQPQVSHCSPASPKKGQFLIEKQWDVNAGDLGTQRCAMTTACCDNSLSKIQPGQKQVYVSHIETPGKFWIQFAENEQYIVGINEVLEIGIETNSKYLLDGPPVAGQLYSVKHPEFGNCSLITYFLYRFSTLRYFLLGFWCRAKVLSKINENRAAAIFVEYGDCQIVPISNIRKVPRLLQNIPFMAIPCKLAAVQLDCWPQKSIDVMKNICNPETLCKAVFRPQTANDVSMEIETLFIGDINVLEFVFEL